MLKHFGAYVKKSNFATILGKIIEKTTIKNTSYEEDIYLVQSFVHSNVGCCQR